MKNIGLKILKGIVNIPKYICSLKKLYFNNIDMDDFKKSIEKVREVEQVIEDDVKQIESDCKDIRCNPIKRVIYDFCKLLYDILFFYKKCKNN